MEEHNAPLLTEGHEHKLEIIPPYSIIQCRRSDIIYRNGKEIARSYHRHVCHPKYTYLMSVQNCKLVPPL